MVEVEFIGFDLLSKDNSFMIQFKNSQIICLTHKGTKLVCVVVDRLLFQGRFRIGLMIMDKIGQASSPTSTHYILVEIIIPFFLKQSLPK